MKPELQRIAIAEFHGWEFKSKTRHEVYIEQKGNSWYLLRPKIHPRNGGEEYFGRLASEGMGPVFSMFDVIGRPSDDINGIALGYCFPDYPKDLNAIHEVEKILNDDNSLHGLVFYCNTLMDICKTHRACVTATAAQRAEAFLRTINKWVE